MMVLWYFGTLIQLPKTFRPFFAIEKVFFNVLYKEEIFDFPKDK